ncbi:MAG: hypothetical protein KGI28_10380, partial [Thaumarchaeota archaeon]|nr:hypothetical protein [Nitrososphaerota archaeon]
EIKCENTSPRVTTARPVTTDRPTCPTAATNDIPNSFLGVHCLFLARTQSVTQWSGADMCSIPTTAAPIT